MNFVRKPFARWSRARPLKGGQLRLTMDKTTEQTINIFFSTIYSNISCFNCLEGPMPIGPMTNGGALQYLCNVRKCIDVINVAYIFIF